MRTSREQYVADCIAAPAAILSDPVAVGVGTAARLVSATAAAVGSEEGCNMAGLDISFELDEVYRIVNNARKQLDEDFDDAGYAADDCYVPFGGQPLESGGVAAVASASFSTGRGEEPSRERDLTRA